MARIERGTLGAGLLVAAVFATGTAHAEDHLQIGIGADYSSGDYGGTEETEILAVPLSARYTAGGFILRASIPYIYIKGPGNVVPGDGGAIPGGPEGPVTSENGIGDLSLGAAYSFVLGQGTFLDIGGRVKVPTASEAKNLGTGTTDFTAQAELFKVFGPVAASVRGGRRFNGSNERFPLRDVWQAGAGIYYLQDQFTLGLDYDWREASLPTSSDRSEVIGSITYKVTPQIRVQGYGYAGLSDGSPDAGGGLQLLYRFAM